MWVGGKVRVSTHEAQLSVTKSASRVMKVARDLVETNVLTNM
jgi:hypothetical protein